MCNNACGHLKRTCQLGQRDITVLGHQFFEKGLMRRELSMPSGATSGRGYNRAGLMELTFPPDPGCRRQLQPRCSGPPAQTLGNVLFKTRAKR